MPAILPDPLNPYANLVYFNESVETVKEEVLSAETTANKTETALVPGENDDSEEPSPQQRLPLFLGGFLQRRKTRKKRTTRKVPSLLWPFQSPVTQNPPPPPNRRLRKKPKKKTTLSGCTVRMAFIVATLLVVAPIVANELEERISIQPSTRIRLREELFDSDSEDPIVPKVEEKEMVKEALEEESFQKSSLEALTKGQTITICRCTRTNEKLLYRLSRTSSMK
jgi:hypothetical protein